MNMERIDDLLAELARTHKVALSPDDPVAMLVTINRFLLREFATTQEQMIQGFREAIATSSSEWNKLANKRAEAILNATILAAKNAVATGAETGLTAGLPPFLEAGESIARRLENQLRRTRRLLYFLLTAVAFLTFAVAVFAVLYATRR